MIEEFYKKIQYDKSKAKELKIIDIDNEFPNCFYVVFNEPVFNGSLTGSYISSITKTTIKFNNPVKFNGEVTDKIYVVYDDIRHLIK